MTVCRPSPRFWPWLASLAAHGLVAAACWGYWLGDSVPFHTPALHGRTVSGAIQRTGSRGLPGDDEGFLSPVPASGVGPLELVPAAASRAARSRLRRDPGAVPLSAADVELPRQEPAPPTRRPADEVAQLPPELLSSRQPPPAPQPAAAIRPPEPELPAVPVVPRTVKEFVPDDDDDGPPASPSAEPGAAQPAVAAAGGRSVHRMGQQGHAGSLGNDPSTPEALDNRPPVYPPLAVANRWQGTVVLRLRITAAGTVEHLEVVGSSGHAVLDEAARVAVRDWRFRPAVQDGRNVPATVRLPVVFDLSAR